MHCLVGTFIKELPEEILDEVPIYPVKIVLPPNKSRVLYFKTPKEQKEWSTILKEVVGYANLLDYYVVDKTIGKGQFGVVKLAKHKTNEEIVAIKTISKANMKSIEVY